MAAIPDMEAARPRFAGGCNQDCNQVTWQSGDEASGNEAASGREGLTLGAGGR